MAEVDSLEISIEASATKAVERVAELIKKLEELKAAYTNVPNNTFGGGKGPKVPGPPKSTKQDYSSLREVIASVGKEMANMQPQALKAAKAAAQASNALRSIGGEKFNPSVEQVSDTLDSLSASLKSTNALWGGTKANVKATADTFAMLPPNIQRAVLANAKMQNSNNKTAKSFGVLGTGISSSVAKFGIYFAAFRRLASAMGGWVKESNDYVENLNLFTVAMGDYAKSAKAYAEEVQSVMGIDPSEWMRNQGVFMQMATGFGVVTDKAALMSKNLTQLGYDISSFYNISIEDAMTKLQSGMAGEIEPLRRLGYAIDVATLQQVAYRNGIEQNVNAMTQAQKAQLRYVAIMEQSENAMGDLARTIQTPANAMRILQQQVTQLARAAGNLLIPALQQIIPWVQAVVEVLTDAVQALANLFGFQLPTIDYSGLNGVSTGGEEAEEALGGAADAAKELKNAMLGIDELNVISPPDAKSGGAGVDAGLGDLPLELPEYDFLKGLEEQTGRIKEILEEILPLVLGIGAGLATWKIASKLIPDLSLLEGILGGLLVSAGVTLLIDSIKEILFGDGLTWKSILTGAAGGALAGGGIGLLLAKSLGLSWKDGMLTGAVIGMGIAVEVLGITDIIANGIDLENVLTTIVGGLGLVAGGGLLGTKLAGFILTAFKGSAVANAISSVGGSMGAGIIGAAIGGIVAGVPMFITGLYDSLKNGISWLSATLTAFGSTLAGAGVGAIVGMLGGPIGAGIGALIGLAVGLITDFGVWLYQHWEEVKQTLSSWWNGIVQFFTDALPNWWNETIAPWFTLERWSELLYNIGYAFGQAWGSVVSFWTESVPEWWNSNVAPWFTMEKWSSLFSSIGKSIQSAWSSIVTWWDEKILSWWNESVVPWFTLERWAELGSNIWSGITSGLGNLWDGAKKIGSDIFGGITEGLGGLWNGAKDLAGNFVGGFRDGLDSHSPSQEMVDVGEDALEGLFIPFGRLSTITDMLVVELGNMRAAATAFSNEVLGMITLSLDTFLASLKEAQTQNQRFVGAMETMFKNMSANSVSAINAIISKLNAIPRNITTVHTVITQTKSSTATSSTTKTFASGGFPDHGQLFIAREAGPELVGTIGGQTAVANNSQIVEGIRQGVAEAEQSQNALLREQNELLMAILQKTGTINISGKTIKAAYDRENRQRGASIMSGGVLAY